MASTNVGSIHYDLGLKTQNFDKEMQSVSGKLDKVGSKMRSVGKRMTIGLTLPIAAAGFAAFKAAADYEQLTVAMTTMLGSADKAKKLLKELDDLAVKTPFSISEVQDAARQMLAYGIEAEKVVETTRMLGDVSAGLGVQTFPQLTLAFGQIKAKGKLMGQELLQLTNAGFNLADAMGVSRGELMEMMETGDGVTFEQVEKAFKRATGEGGRFHNMMQNQSKTTSGQISNLKDEIIRLGRDIGEQLLPIARDIVAELKKWVERFAALSPEQKKMIMLTAAFVAALGPLAYILGSVLTLVKFSITAYKGMTIALHASKAAVLGLKAGGTMLIPTLKAMAAWLMGGGNSVGGSAVLAKGKLGALKNFMASRGMWMGAMKLGLVAAAVWGLSQILKATKSMIDAYRAVQSASRAATNEGDAFSDAISKIRAAHAAGKISKAEMNKKLSSIGAAGDTSGLQRRAMGGAFQAGKPLLVGERGPELYMPNRGGTIVPNHALSGNTTINGNINIGSQSDANYFFNRLNRSQDLLAFGMSPVGGKQ